MREITESVLKQRLHYSPDTGEFTWIIRCKGIRFGSIAGGIHYLGYRRISMFGSFHMAHRLAWLYVHGHLPDQEIDHINGNKSDNRICNLRQASRSENMQNRHRAQVNSSSGVLGITYCAKTKKWIARIFVDGKKLYLGRFLTKEEAHSAYLEKKREVHKFCVI